MIITICVNKIFQLVSCCTCSFLMILESNFSIFLAGLSRGKQFTEFRVPRLTVISNQ